MEYLEPQALLELLASTAEMVLPAHQENQVRMVLMENLERQVPQELPVVQDQQVTQAHQVKMEFQGLPGVQGQLVTQGHPVKMEFRDLPGVEEFQAKLEFQELLVLRECREILVQMARMALVQAHATLTQVKILVFVRLKLIILAASLPKY